MIYNPFIKKITAFDAAEAMKIAIQSALNGHVSIIEVRRDTIPQCCIDAKSFCFKCGKYYWE